MCTETTSVKQDDFYRRKLAAGGAILAPMAGYSDAPFRRLCREFGSAWAVTEMVSAKALVLGDLQGIEIGAPYPGEPDLVIQVFGGEPEVVAAGGRILYDRYRPAALDLNMGCPVKKVTGKSCGAKLMLEPSRAAAIVRALAAAVPVPVSAKLRLGFDKINVFEVAHALEDAGASLITVHGRTAAQKYSGDADWNTIREVAERLTIPVVGSGNVTTAAQYSRYRSWGLGVMVGRGAIGRPWIFAELQAGELQDSELQGGASLALDAIVRLAYRHAALNCDWYGEARGMLPMRAQLSRYFVGAPDYDRLRSRLVQVSSLADLADCLQTHFGPVLGVPVFGSSTLGGTALQDVDGRPSGQGEGVPTGSSRQLGAQTLLTAPSAVAKV
ncbi:MAG: tRNA-dihydrouridine synthase family protein [Trueperaceae bacterium]|nr:tRNA-dihydrouridine synthase family protein [Trueperaceae bacterium]